MAIGVLNKLIKLYEKYLVKRNIFFNHRERITLIWIIKLSQPIYSNLEQYRAVQYFYHTQKISSLLTFLPNNRNLQLIQKNLHLKKEQMYM